MVNRWTAVAASPSTSLGASGLHPQNRRRSMKAPQLLFGALALVMSVSACQRQTSQAELKQTASQAADRIKSESVKAGEKLEDAWLATKIHAKFIGDRDIKARDIKVSANDGVVTLTGHVLNESERQLALTLAKNTDGVKQVVDKLDAEVAGPPPVRTVNSGTPGATATTGASASPTSPASASPPVAASDDTRITTSIQSKYFMDDRIKGRHIVVTTNAGVVTLNGDVADDTERAEALLLARTTEGVKRVEDNLTISPATAPVAAPPSPAAAPPSTSAAPAAPAAPPSAGKPAVTVPDTDAALADRVKSQLTSDNEIKSAPMEVTAKGGVVTIQGTVATRAAKDRALTVVRGIDGVTQVVDRIQISPAKSSPTKSSSARKAKR
jgi:osmotically-inducible protein OsmY